MTARERHESKKKMKENAEKVVCVNVRKQRHIVRKGDRGSEMSENPEEKRLEKKRKRKRGQKNRRKRQEMVQSKGEKDTRTSERIRGCERESVRSVQSLQVVTMKQRSKRA